VIVPEIPEEPFPLEVIISVSVVGTLLLVMIIAIVIWRVKCVPKAQTHCVTSAEYMTKTESVDMMMKSDKIKDSVDCYVNENYEMGEENHEMGEENHEMGEENHEMGEKNYEGVPPTDTAFRTFRKSRESMAAVEK
jgi:hypothetical protein